MSVSGLTALNLGFRCMDCVFYDTNDGDENGDYLCTLPAAIYVRPTFGCLEIDTGQAPTAMPALIQVLFGRRATAGALAAA